jgi:Protein of unknown function (DUF3313)
MPKPYKNLGQIMRTLLLSGAVALLAACAAEPTIDTNATAEKSFDGLSPISNARFANAWIDPDVDLADYDKILLGDAEFEFRAVKKSARTSTMGRSNQREYWISDEGKQKLIDTVTEVFLEELQKSESFTIVGEAGPDVLIIVGALHDIVSNVPPDLIGRGEIFLSSVGEATLVLEARDSLSGETIYRAVDRRRIEQPGGGMNTAIRSTPVTTWSEVRRWARRWATRLREGLDSIHD